MIFTRNATEGINLVAQTWGRTNVRAGDEILISAIEHHSNIVPWYMLCREKGATLRVIPMFDSGELDMEAFVAPARRAPASWRSRPCPTRSAP